MNEPPSHELVRQLTELQLCHPSDLRRARGRVRRLSFDLPAFDSVWIDSLVQLRLLTPYQAKQLEQGRADQLRIGSFVVIDEMGRGHHGATFLAQRLNRRDRCVVKRQRIEPFRMQTVSRQMELVLERANGFVHPQLVMPNEIVPSNSNELVTVSRFVPGLPLNELLVRRGRFPASIVFEIGRQLMDGLAALHAKSLVHGDIRMSNVRLTDTGLAVLVDGGIRQVVHPEITIHDTLALEAYDGMGPELIGTGASASASSELYAVGCLLWQLLAGRPPFTTADPLAKLASHQTLTINDVRTWAPDTPPVLAETIRQMTSSSPDHRPRSFEEVLQRWGRSGSFGRSRLKQFRRLFDRDVPHFAGPIAQDKLSNKIWIAALLFAVTGAAAMFYDSGLRNVVLEIGQDLKSKIRAAAEPAPAKSNTTVDSESTSPGGVTTTRELLPLPSPSPDGVILLSEHGPYEVTNVNFDGDLKIRGAIGASPEIHVVDAPLKLIAKSVSLEQITVRHVGNTDLVMLVTIRSQRLKVLNCQFVAARSDADAPSRGIASLAWMPIEPHAQTGLIEIENASFQGLGSAILFAQTPRSVRITNSLKTGAGAFVSLRPMCLAMEMRLVLDRVTLRETGPLLQLAGEPANKTGAAPIQIEANYCVFKLADAKSGLVVIESERPRADVANSVELKANESIVVPGPKMLATYDPVRQLSRREDDDEHFVGLSYNGVEFAGAQFDRTGDSRTAGLQGPQRDSTELPGIDPIRLGPAARTTEFRR